MQEQTIVEPAVPRIQSLARADAILTAVMNHSELTMPLSSLADSLGLNKTTVFNLAESLALLGFLERSTDPKGYKLGLRCLELGRHVQRAYSILEPCRPVLRDICLQTKETVNLAVPYLHEAMIIESLQGHFAVRAIAYAGTRSHYHSSACGKALLAHFPKEQRDWIYKSIGFPRMTPHTICNRSEMEDNLEKVRSQGFATDEQENELGLFCIGMPVFNLFEEAVASISVSGVIQRMTPELICETVDLLQSKTQEITVNFDRS